MIDNKRYILGTNFKDDIVLPDFYDGYHTLKSLELTQAQYFIEKAS